jgi:hypothetical protein
MCLRQLRNEKKWISLQRQELRLKNYCNQTYSTWNTLTLIKVWSNMESCKPLIYIKIIIIFWRMTSKSWNQMEHWSQAVILSRGMHIGSTGIPRGSQWVITNKCMLNHPQRNLFSPQQMAWHINHRMQIGRVQSLKLTLRLIVELTRTLLKVPINLIHVVDLSIKWNRLKASKGLREITWPSGIKSWKLNSESNSIQASERTRTKSRRYWN